MSAGQVDKSAAAHPDSTVCREVVYFFDAQEQVAAELPYQAFVSLLQQGKAHPYLSARASGLGRAAYCIVGNGLTLKAVVLFQFLVTDEGRIDSSFNLPLTYLAQQAGRFSIGDKSVRKASRGQCPVPWHAVNLWEPENPTVFQALCDRLADNQLNLSSNLYSGDDPLLDAQEDTDGGIELTPLSDFDAGKIDASDVGPAQLGAPSVEPMVAGASAQVSRLTDKLSQVFGQSGKLSVQEMIRLHAEQMAQIQDQLREQFRREFEVQQVSFLDQIRIAQEEIHQLRTALSQEQSRNRRLQQMLRGDL